MKHEWRKHEKQFYLPKNKPEIIDIPEFKFFSIKGQGNPNDDHFPDYIAVLYSLSYAVRMSPKKGIAPEGYFEYTVYPLEGVWDIKDEAKDNYDGTLNKDDLLFNLMIRQADFVSEAYALETIDRVQKSKPHDLLKEVQFETITEGTCIQMMHLGSYDEEQESFTKMEAFAEEKGFIRVSHVHREIYLNDARKIPAEKLKTVLRFQIE